MSFYLCLQAFSNVFSQDATMLRTKNKLSFPSYLQQNTWAIPKKQKCDEPFLKHLILVSKLVSDLSFNLDSALVPSPFLLYRQCMWSSSFTTHNMKLNVVSKELLKYLESSYSISTFQKRTITTWVKEYCKKSSSTSYSKESNMH